jgi:hypothetical protein
MSPRTDLNQLRQIAIIRDLQSVAAKADALRAAAVRREADARLEDTQRERDAVEQHWQATLSAPSLDIQTLGWWSSALQRQDGVVQHAAREARNAGQELERRAENFHAATLRSDMARDVVRDFIADAATRRDEAAMQQASDRHLQRGGTL